MRSWQLRLVVGVGSSLLLVGIFLVGRLLWLHEYLADDLERFYQQPDHRPAVYLEHFPLQRQRYANSCGPTTLSMVYSYLVQPITEQEFAERFGLSLGRSGMLPATFHASLRRSLVGFDTAMDVNVRDSELLTAIYAQLQRGLPVPIYFATTNGWAPPAHDTHFSAVIGLRPQQRTVVIANAYGFQEELPVVDFLQAIKYRNFDDAPLAFRLGVLLGIINQNILYRITPAAAAPAGTVGLASEAHGEPARTRRLVEPEGGIPRPRTV